MITRKLVQAGTASTSVSLPKKWLLDNQLHKGDTVFLDCTEDQVVITTTSKIKPTDAFFINSSSNKYLDQMMFSGFLSSKKYIVIIGLTNNSTTEVLRIIKKMPYLNIEEQNSSSLKLAFILDVTELDLKKEIGKMKFLLENFFSLLFEDKRPDKNTDLEDAYDRITVQILLMMKTIKIAFFKYDRIDILKYKQILDSYYFLSKKIRGIWKLHEQQFVFSEKFKREVGKFSSHINGILKALHETDLDETLIILEGTLKSKDALFRLMLSENEPETVKQYFILYDLYESLIGMLYAIVNNFEGKSVISNL